MLNSIKTCLNIDLDEVEFRPGTTASLANLKGEAKYLLPLSFRPTHSPFELFELAIHFVRSKYRGPEKVRLTFLGYG